MNTQRTPDSASSLVVMPIEQILGMISNAVHAEMKSAITVLEKRDEPDAWFTRKEALAYMAISENTCLKYRKERRAAKNQAEKDRAFPPDYETPFGIRYRKSEIDAFMAGTLSTQLP